MSSKEGQLSIAKVKAHASLEALTLCDGHQRLDVRALHLSRLLADLPLADDCASVGAEGHAAAPPSVEVDDSQADVVRIGKHLHLDVHRSGRRGRQNVGAKLHAAIRDFVGFADLRNLGSAEGFPEGAHLREESRVAPFPVHAAVLGLREGLSTVEEALTLEVQTVERMRAKIAPGASVRTVQVSEGPTSSIRAAERGGIKEGCGQQVRTLACEVHKCRAALSNQQDSAALWLFKHQLLIIQLPKHCL
mmetsp:Transcript_65360/g.151634  ORF Transcript_65360/g.151634 Transcript_65360/m.151634 type:complete len:248 (-) Transcript_65360:249-992(-)